MEVLRGAARGYRWPESLPIVHRIISAMVLLLLNSLTIQLCSFPSFSSVQLQMRIAGDIDREVLRRRARSVDGLSLLQ